MTDDQQLQTNDALRTSEGLLRLLLEAGGHGWYDLDVPSGRTVVNERYAQMMGYDPATFVETNAAWRERLHPDDRDAVYAEYQAYVAGRRDFYRVEFRQRTADGSYRWVLSVGEIVERMPDGAPRRMLGTHTDIHALKESQESLRRSEDRFRRVVESAPVGIFIQTEGRFAFANNAAVRLFGAASAADLEGQAVVDRFAAEDRSAVADRIHQLNMEFSAVNSRLERVLRPDDTAVEVVVSAVPFRYRGHDGALVFAVDVTERAASERQVRAHLDELRRWQGVMLDREDRVQALKREVNDLCRTAGVAPRYASQLPEEAE